MRQCATLYNAALQERRDAYQMAGVSVRLYDQMKALTLIRKDDAAWEELDVQVGRGVLRRLDRGFKAFFRRVKAGEAPGFPRFKSWRRFRCLEIAQPRAGMVKVSADGRKAYVRVKGLPVIQLRLRRALPASEGLRSLRIVRRPTGVSVDLGYAVEREPWPANDAAVGLDFGVNNRIATSDGEMIARAPSLGRAKQPAARRSAERKRHGSGAALPGVTPDDVDAPTERSRAQFSLRVAPDNVDAPDLIHPQDGIRTLQQRIARGKRGSRRQRALRRQLARARHRQRVRNRNECHRITTALVRRYGRIAVEKLTIQGMTARAAGTLEKPGRNVAAKSGLNREILAQTWGLIREQLRYKAAWAGREFVEVDPRYTSRECWSCGHQTPQSEYRTYRCGVCGTTFDRDTNAAINVMRRGFGRDACGVGISPTLFGAITTAGLPFLWDG